MEASAGGSARRVVLFTGASEQWSSALADAAGEVLFVEPLAFEWANEARLAAALAGEGAHAGLVLTSPRAVEALARRWDEAARARWSAQRVYAVGARTGRDAARLLGLSALGVDAGCGEALAERISTDGVPTGALLFPCGDLAAALPAALSARGVPLDSITVYSTREHAGLRAALRRLAASAPPHALVFFSPSGCEFVLQELRTLGDALADAPHFAIGPSTARRLRVLGRSPAGVLARPDAHCLARCLREYFSSEGCSEPVRVIRTSLDVADGSSMNE